MLDIQTLQLYCLADRDFYEAPDRMADTAPPYVLDGCPAEGWRQYSRGLWNVLMPTHTTLPEQGWKIHVSSVPAIAETTLAKCAAVCFDRGIPFKHLRSPDALALAVGKYMPRSSSGKFVTVYPADEEQFAELLGELAAAVDGLPGPYILSDLRIGGGPVHVRYGAFSELWCPGPQGTPVPALRAPSGDLVPDDRLPVFKVPAWVTVPSVLLPHIAARKAAHDDTFPYTVREPLHFSNSGGVYLAEHRGTGEQVVLREARPHSGLDRSGADAVERLHHEHRILRRLEGLSCVPRVYGVRTVWEHHYLIEEYIEGETLHSALITRNPLRFRDPTPASVRDYLRWATSVTEQLSAALDAVHARGLSFGDLHPSNVVVRPDDSVVLVDFEFAADLDDPDPVRAGAPGFMPPPGMSGAEADRYALRAVWLMMLVPIVDFTQLAADKTAVMEELARSYFHLPRDAGPPLVGGASVNRGTVANGGKDGDSSRATEGEDAVAALFDLDSLDWPTLRDRIAAGILDTATPERADRLFPAEPDVFITGGFGLAHGAAGVLLALHRAGVAVPRAHIDWLVACAERSVTADWRGLYDGLYGVAVTLDELGRRDEALAVLARARAARAPMSADLFGGLAGTALAQCHFAEATGDAGLFDEAVRTADRLDTLVRSGKTNGLVLPPSAGLLRGMSGAAVLHLTLYRLTGHRSRLRAAHRALRRELGRCVTMPDGTMQVREGKRHLLYLDGGSGGVALAAAEYLKHDEEPAFAGFIDAVRRGCEAEFVREPGLFQGRAGLTAMLALLSGPDGEKPVAAQISRLSWHAVQRDGGLYFPGVKLRRFSCDLASGSAGVLLAVHTALHPERGFLPLLP
ncbi:MAG: protein kinase/lanthionine synthetase C family protein [Catenulispora sp.]|nr:protein kinase/lanthionine synthetase C family protein [Catenulispora sp.]